MTETAITVTFITVKDSINLLRHVDKNAMLYTVHMKCKKKTYASFSLYKHFVIQFVTLVR